MTHFPTHFFYREHFKLVNSFDQFFFYNRVDININQVEMALYSLFKDFTPSNVKHLIS